MEVETYLLNPDTDKSLQGGYLVEVVFVPESTPWLIKEAIGNTHPKAVDITLRGVSQTGILRLAELVEVHQIKTREAFLKVLSQEGLITVSP